MEETFGRYRLLERLGQGGMAEVFKAKSFGVEGFEKVLVIKRILPGLVESKRFVDLFVHEAKLAVRLSHANIVQVFDLGKVEDGTKPQYFIAMEYVAGLDLATLLARCRRQGLALPIGMCVYLAAEVAKGLDHAHRRRDEQMRPLGIVHRDVSPQNVLLSWEGEVKVTDFGIAKARDSLDENRDETKAATLQGKYAYMSPEQASGVEVDARSDLFSLGAVLYESLAGVNPFAAPTMFETLRRVKAGEFPPLELIRQDAPKALSVLVAKALAKPVAERFPDAGRMYEELLAFLYASGARFGPNDLSEFLARHRDPESGAVVDIEADRVLEEEAGATSSVHDRTPVEVPSSGRSSPIGPQGGGEVSGIASRAGALGERQEVTALGFSLGGRETVSDERRARMREILTRYGARVLDDDPAHSTAVFGLGEADGRDTETAVRCALVLLRGLASGENAPSAGVHAGRVLIGPDGEPVKDERLASLVATAHLMARLSDGRCGISAPAARNVRSLFSLEAPPDPGRKPGAEGGLLVGEAQAAGEALGRFVGRKEELRRIGEVLAVATRRRVQVITIRGDQGIGKTRMLLEVDRRLRRGDFDVAFHLASCAPNGRSHPLSGVTAMLQVLCGIQDGDPTERIVQVEPRLRALGLRDEEVSAVLSQLGAQNRAGATAPVLRAAFTRMVTSLAEDHLHAFAWDNAQAMDDDSLELLDGAIQRMAGVRAVFVLSSRTGSTHPLERLANHHLVPLPELSETEVAKMIALRTGARTAPRELVDFCRERAGGHPLFLEELVRELFDAGGIVVENGGIVQLRLDGDVAAPRPLRTLLASRAARLPPVDRGVLQAAAILGDPVELSTLAVMLGVSLGQVEKSLAFLEARDLVRRSGASAIAFASPILREVLVDAMPAELRREMHAAAGAANEASLGEQAAAQADRVAMHFYEAGELDRAATHFARSGQRRLSARKYEPAARDLVRALELCDPTRHGAEELAGWLRELASAVYHVRSARGVPELVDKLLARIDADAPIATRVEARVDVARILGATNKFDDADELLAAAHRLADGDAALASKALVVEGELALRRGDFRRALERFVEVSRGGGIGPADERRVAIGLAQAHAAFGERDAALAALDRAASLSPADDVASMCERAKLRSLVLYFTRDFDGAAREGERGVELARAAGLTYEVAINLHNVGDALLRLGELPRAYANLQQSCAVCDEVSQDHQRMAAQNRGYLAYLDALNGVTGADKTLKDFIGYAGVHGYAWDEVNGRYLLAKLHEKRGDARAARAEFERCGEMAKTLGFRLFTEDCEGALASLARA